MNFTNRTLELREIETLEGHDDRIWCAAWNPATGADGVPAMIASCGADKKVLIWEQDPATGSFRCDIKTVVNQLHSVTVKWCEWVASSGTLVTSSIDGKVLIWKGFGPKFMMINKIEHDKSPVSVSVNASGLFIAICIPPKWICISMLDGPGCKILTLPAFLGCARMSQWHPLKDILFSCGYDNTIKIWVPNARMLFWDCVQTLGESNSERRHMIQAFAFNSRGNKIAACSDDLTIRIWSVDIEKMRFGKKNASGKHLCTLTGYHDKTVYSVHWSREEIICTGAADGAICFFIKNEDGSEPAYKLLLKKDHAHDKPINSVQWCSKDNTRLVSASDDKTIKIWELASLPRF